jgi:hypothetical protein
VFAKLAMPVLAVVLLAVTGSHKLSLLVPALIGLAVLVGAVALFALLMWKKAVALAGRGARHGHLAAAAAAAQAAGAWLGQGGGPLPAPLQRPGRLPLAGADRRHHHQPPGAVPGLPRGRPSGRHQPRAGELGGGPRRLLARPAAVGLTPGGVGVVELTYIAGLVLAGGGVRAAAVAATLLFRLLTDGLEIPLGGITYLIWLRNKRWRAVPPATVPAAVPASPP